MNKNLWTKIITCVLLIATLLSVAIIPASASADYPDGGTLYFEDINGTKKTVNISAYSTKDGHLLKKMVMKGPAGDYWCESLHLWGYDYSHSDMPWNLLIDCEVSTGFGGNTIYDGRSWHIIVGAEFAWVSGGSYDGNGYWILRSPVNGNPNESRGILSYGHPRGYDSVCNTSNGIVPALQIKL